MKSQSSMNPRSYPTSLRGFFSAVFTLIAVFLLFSSVSVVAQTASTAPSTYPRQSTQTTPTEIETASSSTAPKPTLPSSTAPSRPKPATTTFSRTTPSSTPAPSGAPGTPPQDAPARPTPASRPEPSTVQTPLPETATEQDSNSNKPDQSKPLQRTRNSFFNDTDSNTTTEPQTMLQRLSSAEPASASDTSVKKIPPPLREWIVISHSLSEAESQRRALSKLQLKIIRRTQLQHLGRFISVFRLPENVEINEIAKTLQREFPDWKQEANKRFFPLSASERSTDPVKNWGQNAIGLKLELAETCSKKTVLAMLDSGVNTQLAEFSGADIHFRNLNNTDVKTNQVDESFRHGSSVAALLVGREQVNGMLPNATLHAINIFSSDNEAGLHTRSDWIFTALNEVAGIKPPVQIVNLSFGGDYSAEMESIFQLLNKRMLFVAAAGNSGENTIQYPAAYDNVIAVGAINSELKKSTTSSYGEGLDMVAPGEDIWTINEKGDGYFASGTSFAAPFITAIYALSKTTDNTKTKTIAINDLGDKGKDPYYGAGLPQFLDNAGLCQ